MINLLFILIIPSILSGQQTELDSLEELLSSNISYDEKVEIYKNVIWPYTRSDPDHAIKLTDDFKDLAKKNDDMSSIMTTIYYYGTSYKNMGRLPESLSFFQEYYNHFLKTTDTASVANVLYQLGAVHANMGNYTEGLDYYHQCILLDEKLGRRKSMAATIAARASLYKVLNQLDRSADDHRRALKIFEEEGDIHQAAHCHLNLGNTHSLQKQFDLALERYAKAEDLSLEVNYPFLLAHVAEGRGGVFELQKDYNNALLAYGKALQIRQEMGHIRSEILTENKMASLYIKIHQPKKAIQLANRTLAKSIDQNIMLGQEQAYKALADANKKMGIYNKALEYHENYSAIKDSILNASISEQLAEMDAKFETSRKEAEIDRLSFESEIQSVKLNQQKIALIVAALIVGILIFLFRNIYRKSQKIEKQRNVIQKSLREKEFLLKEIHHRVKNNLQVISSLLKLQSESVDDVKAQSVLDEGRHRVRSMAIIHQSLYQEDNLSGIQMKEYLTQLANELFDTYQINQENIKLKIDVESLKLDVDSTVPIGLIVNELISNSLKYGFPDNREGTISIALHQREDRLSLVVKDDGIGFDNEKIDKKSFGHLMIEAFAERLQADYKLEGNQGANASFLIRDFKIAA